MAQLILDDQLFPLVVQEPLSRWITVRRPRDLRPNEVIKDERVLTLLREVKQLTFVMIDSRFWSRARLDEHHCILFFALTNNEQPILPTLLRRLFRVAPFRTRASRMGIVARVSTVGVEYWRLGDDRLHHLSWER